MAALITKNKTHRGHVAELQGDVDILSVVLTLGNIVFLPVTTGGIGSVAVAGCIVAKKLAAREVSTRARHAHAFFQVCFSPGDVDVQILVQLYRFLWTPV